MCLCCVSRAHVAYTEDASVHVQRQHFAVHSPFGRVYRYRSFPGSTERASFLLPAGRDTLIPSAREQSGSHHENLAVFQSTRFIPRTSVESSRSHDLFHDALPPYTLEWIMRENTMNSFNGKGNARLILILFVSFSSSFLFFYHYCNWKLSKLKSIAFHFILFYFWNIWYIYKNLFIKIYHMIVDCIGKIKQFMSLF